MNASRQNAADREASLRRVAIVLSSLPAPLAAKLLSSFDQEKRTSLRQTMTGLSDVDPLERKRAIESFSGTLQQGVLVKAPARETSSGDRFVASTASEPRTGVSQKIDAADFADRQQNHAHLADQPSSDALGSSHPLAFLDRVPGSQVIEILSAEHPQTVAVVLASVAPEQAATLIQGLPRSMRDDVIRRIGRMSHVEPSMLGDVADSLHAKCLQIELPRESADGGQALRAIMAKMMLPGDASQATLTNQTAPSPPASADSTMDVSAVDRAFQDRTGNAGHDPSTAASRANDEGSRTLGSASSAMRQEASPLSSDQINQRIESLSPMQLCVSLGRVSARDALLTLCGMPMKQANRAIAMLPKAQQKTTRSQLANLGPLQLAEIDRAKEHVARASLDEAAQPIAA